jgi:hypothetical protein
MGDAGIRRYARRRPALPLTGYAKLSIKTDGSTIPPRYIPPRDVTPRGIP